MGGKGSGGFRPSAPQNNPANVSATGGNGQSGKQPVRYISGLPYGQGQTTMAQQAGAPMAASRPTPPISNVIGPVATLDQPTMRPNEPVTAGAALGPGPGTEALKMPVQDSGNEDIETIRAYFPAMEFWANQPGTSQTTKDYVRYLGTLI